MMYKFFLFQLASILIIYLGMVKGLPSFHPDTFKIDCSRFYEPESKPTHTSIFHSMIYHKLYGMLKFSGKSSKETIWNLLAKLIVPLPRRNRGEILLKFCRSVYEIDTADINGNQLKNCFNDLFNRNNKGFAGIKKGRMYSAASNLYEKIILQKSAILGELLFKALESNDLTTIYKIIFARARHEILPIIEKQNEFYPFDEKLKKIYSEKIFKEIWDENCSNLESHIKFKKRGANNSMQKVYDLLLKRINAIISKRLLDDFDYISHLNGICNLSMYSTINKVKLHELIELIENLLILFEFKSEEALEFGNSLQKKDNQSPNCLKNLKEIKVIMKNIQSNRNSTLQPNADNQANEVLHDTQQITTEQIYLDQLRIIMKIAMLTESGYHYLSRLHEELTKLHRDGNHSKAINFLFLHIDEDMYGILAKYTEHKLEKELQKFKKPLIGPNNFYYAYKNVLLQIKNDKADKQCYIVTETENSLIAELRKLELKNDAKYSRITKLMIILLQTILKHYERNIHELEKFKHSEVPIGSDRELIEKDLIKNLYLLNPSELMSNFQFDKIIADYLSKHSIDSNWHLIIKLMTNEIKNFKEKLAHFDKKLLDTQEKISEDDKIFPIKIAEIMAEFKILKQKYLSSCIKSIIDGNIEELNVQKLNEELNIWFYPERTLGEPSSSSNKKLKTGPENAESSSSEREVIKSVLIDEGNRGKGLMPLLIHENENHCDDQANDVESTSEIQLSTNEIQPDESENIPVSFPAVNMHDEILNDDNISNLQMPQEKSKPKLLWSKLSNLWKKRT